MTKDDLKTLATLPKLLSVMRKLAGEAMELQGLAATLGMMGQAPAQPVITAYNRGIPLPTPQEIHELRGPPQPQPHINSEDTDPRARPIPIQAPTSISDAQADREAEKRMFLEVKRTEREAALAKMKNGG